MDVDSLTPTQLHFWDRAGGECQKCSQPVIPAGIAPELGVAAQGIGRGWLVGLGDLQFDGFVGVPTDVVDAISPSDCILCHEACNDSASEDRPVKIVSGEREDAGHGFLRALTLPAPGRN